MVDQIDESIETGNTKASFRQSLMINPKACVERVQVDPESDTLTTASDLRKGGDAATMSYKLYSYSRRVSFLMVFH